MIFRALKALDSDENLSEKSTSLSMSIQHSIRPQPRQTRKLQFNLIEISKGAQDKEIEKQSLKEFKCWNVYLMGESCEVRSS